MAIVIQHPAMANRQAAARQQNDAAQSHDRGVRIATSELKMHIAIIELSLVIPKNAPCGVHQRRARQAMSSRLAMYKSELQARDIRRAQPIDNQSIYQRVEQLRTRHSA